MEHLKERTVRGGVARLCTQALSMLLRLGFLVILARLLDPKDFGLVAMVTAVTGIYSLFATAGLSSAMVQSNVVTREQVSTLFWINFLVGVLLAVLSVATAPLLVAFYQEPRLFWITVAIGSGFVFGAAGVQHYALLQRQVRYVSLSVVDTLSQFVGIALGVGMALGGFGYWALVAATIVAPAVSTVCLWWITRWIPEKPRLAAGIGSMLRFGGTISLNTLVVYVAYNVDKALLGRFWGADALGLYGKAYQLISYPTEYLNSAVGGVAFAALSRLQEDSARLRSYFLKGYALVVSLTLPLTLFCALFADDIVHVVLGPKWTGAALIFRTLAPTVLIFGMINPLSWLLLSIGLQERSLKIGLVIAPLVIAACVIGLPYGPSGVAFAYSTALSLWLAPHILWCLHGTMVRPRDLLLAVGRPFLAGAAAAVCALAARHYWGALLSPFPRLIFGSGLMLLVYAAILLFVLGQKTLYLSVLRGLKKPALPSLLVS